MMYKKISAVPRVYSTCGSLAHVTSKYKKVSGIPRVYSTCDSLSHVTSKYKKVSGILRVDSTCVSLTPCYFQVQTGKWYSSCLLYLCQFNPMLLPTSSPHLLDVGQRLTAKS